MHDTDNIDEMNDIPLVQCTNTIDTNLIASEKLTEFKNINNKFKQDDTDYEVSFYEAAF